LDTQPGCVCLSSIRRRAHPDADTYGHANSDSYTDCNRYSYPNTYCYAQSDTEATPNSASSPDAAVRK